MRTEFTLAQLADPDTAEANKILRACVHCGFCTATCPTYVLLGDERDSPRGRIYLIKDMLERDRPATADIVPHIDRCLSCLSCMTTCPAGVHYQHLIDQARAHVHETFERPEEEQRLRDLIARTVPSPGRFRLALIAASLARPFKALLPRRLRPLLDLAPRSVPSPSWADEPGVHRAEGKRRMRVALLSGCAQQVIAPQINEATIRLLTRLGAEVVVPRNAGCCGALVHHMGREAPALEAARTNVAAWMAEVDGAGLDAIVVNASGCGTQVKDYGYMLRTDPAWAERAARVSALAKDVSEVVAMLGLGERDAAVPALPVTYHSACSLQHGQRIKREPVDLLRAAGFTVREPAEAHLCCGSAGTYNMLQPKLATELRDRKLGRIAATAPAVIATGNVGCMTQLAGGTDVPVVHTVELLDWAMGGPRPAALGSAARH